MDKELLLKSMKVNLKKVLSSGHAVEGVQIFVWSRKRWNEEFTWLY